MYSFQGVEKPRFSNGEFAYDSNVGCKVRVIDFYHGAYIVETVAEKGTIAKYLCLAASLQPIDSPKTIDYLPIIKKPIMTKTLKVIARILLLPYFIVIVPVMFLVAYGLFSDEQREDALATMKKDFKEYITI